MGKVDKDDLASTVFGSDSLISLVHKLCSLVFNFAVDPWCFINYVPIIFYTNWYLDHFQYLTFYIQYEFSQARLILIDAQIFLKGSLYIKHVVIGARSPVLN